MTAPLTDARLDEIQARAADIGCDDCGCVTAEERQLGGEDVPELIAEIRRLRAEVDRFHATLADNRLGFALAAVRMIANESVTTDADLLRQAILEQLAPFGDAQPEATP